MNYEMICHAAAKHIRQTGDGLISFREENPIEVSTKGKNDFVTQMDKMCEQLLVDGLSSILPEAGFITEEATRNDRNERLNWIVDPIDGTTNFIHECPPFAISVALMEGEEIVVGIVYEMGAKDLFTAWKDGGAYLNDRPIHVAPTKRVGDSLVATGFPYNNFERMEGYMRSFRTFMEQSQGVRRLGSAATDLAYVAAGRYDFFYEYDLKPWDVAAGSLLVREAGGMVSDFRGGNDWLFGREIVASNTQVHKEVVDILGECEI